MSVAAEPTTPILPNTIDYQDTLLVVGAAIFTTFLTEGISHIFTMQ